jgi:hypothetical protein
VKLADGWYWLDTESGALLQPGTQSHKGTFEYPADGTQTFKVTCRC